MNVTDNDNLEVFYGNRLLNAIHPNFLGETSLDAAIVSRIVLLYKIFILNKHEVDETRLYWSKTVLEDLGYDENPEFTAYYSRVFLSASDCLRCGVSQQIC
jgi:hypothetical protein